MYSKCSFLLFTDPEKIIDNFVTWSGAINEKQIGMLDATLEEPLPIILGFIQPHDMSYIEVLENLKVVLWRISSLVDFLVHRPHEGNEFLGNDPVQVTIGNFLIVLVLIRIECLEIVPA